MQIGALKNLWSLDEEYIFLNHGSYGACPKIILAEQQDWHLRLEKQPAKFYKREYLPLASEVRSQVEQFFNATNYEMAFVQNATTAVNTVLKNLVLPPGSEIICGEFTYGACLNALKYYCELKRVKLVLVPVPFPPESNTQIVDAYKEKITAKTKLAFLDHVSSPLGLIYPLKDLLALMQKKGVFTLVDGAHAPGMLPLDLEKLAADAYVGNFHKWMCAPKSIAFLALKNKGSHALLTKNLRGLVIGHGSSHLESKNSLLLQDTEWPGTLDPSPLLCLPKVLSYFPEVVGSWNEVYKHNHMLLMKAYELICDSLQVEKSCPKSMLGAMAAIPLPQGRPYDGSIDPLQDLLFQKEKIEVPIFELRHGERYIRISAQLYNSYEQYEKLLKALEKWT